MPTKAPKAKAAPEAKAPGARGKTPSGKVAAAKGDTGSKRPNGLQQPLRPSAELAAVVGAEPLPRGEVVSKVWAYIKANELQNPENRREILADGKLAAVFGKDTQGLVRRPGTGARGAGAARARREGHLVPAAQRSPYPQVMVAGIPGRARFSWCRLRGRRAVQAGHAEADLARPRFGPYCDAMGDGGGDHLPNVGERRIVLLYTTTVYPTRMS